MHNHQERELAPLDPVALTLALWLGLLATVAGLTRLSDAAAAQAMLDQTAGWPAFAVNSDDAQWVAARLAALGG